MPTLNQLYQTIKTDLESELNITIPIFGKSFLRAFAMVQAGKLWLLYLLLAKVQKNIFVDTADPESMGGTLERFGRVKINRSPFPATAGFYSVTVTGEIGAVIPFNQIFKSDDNSLNPSKLFILDTQTTLTATSQQITLRALELGIDSKLSINDTLTATSPIALVNSTATVFAETVQPQAREDIEVYRQIVIQSYRLEPQGGAGADYRIWSSEVQGVKQSYPYTSNVNTNVVNLFIESPIADSVDGKGSPTAAIIAAVEENIEIPTPTRPSRLPLTATLNVQSVTPLDVVITIDSFVDITTAKQAAIQTAIENALDKIRPFIASIDVVSEQNDTFSSNTIIALILQAVSGSVFGAVTLEVDGNMVNSYQFVNGEIPYLDSISYT
jgi:uncharacterized phage protein gp47/JayE